MDSSSSYQFQFHGFPSSSSYGYDGSMEDRNTSSYSSHSQAEQRRRDRINAQLSILRKLIPKSDKMDKAALLASAVEHIEALKRKVTEASTSFTIPSEIDQVIVDFYNPPQNIIYCGNIEGVTFFRASLCCDDRPEVFRELIRVINDLRLCVIKAEIESIGGRMKNSLVLCNKKGEDCVSIGTLKQSLCGILNVFDSYNVGLSGRARSKRQRMFMSSYYLQ